MGSSNSRHGSRSRAHPRPKTTLKRTISSIFICGSSSSTLPNETEDNSSEDYRNRGHLTKFQRPTKAFLPQSHTEHRLTSPKTKNRAFLVANENPYPEASASNAYQNSSKERAGTSFINGNDDTNRSFHAFDDLSTVENEIQVDNSSFELVESFQETLPSILGLRVPEREQEQRDETVRQDDVASVSSDNLSRTATEIDTRELRLDGRRLIWDSFLTENGGRLSDSQSFSLSSDDDSDGSESGGDSLDGGSGGDGGNLGSQTLNIFRGRQRTSSEIWESIRRGSDGFHCRTGLCPSGLHSYGSCSCESNHISQDAIPRTSLSRIVLLAETLFEVLDEIQRQPLTLPLNMGSLPAPDSIVDSLPVKSHKVKQKSENDIEQCQICLAEYKEGDEIRVLPCRHEYHMSCVDKWLKESHRVCPLCRGDVCEAEATISNPKIPLA